MPDPSRVLRLLADLAPGGARVATGEWDVRDAGPTWVEGADGVRLQARWAGAALLHREEDAGRVGALVLVGPLEVGGTTRHLVAPLLARRADEWDLRLRQDPAPVGLRPPMDATPLARSLGVEATLDPAVADVTPPPTDLGPGLLRSMPRLLAAVDALAAAGVALDGVTGDPRAVQRRAGGEQLWLVACRAAYLEREAPLPDLGQRLVAWAERDVGGTAFAALHDDAPGEPPAVPVPAPGAPASPLPLSRAQREVVAAARTARVTVLSGGPGTGKSHTAVAVALDAVARGRSVLLATRSVHAADVLAELLDRQRGPTPVRFGDGPLGRELATRLADGLPPAPSQDELDDAGHGQGAAAGRVRAAHAALAAALAAVGDAGPGVVLRTAVPGPYVPSADLGALADVVARARAPRGWWQWLRRTAAGREARGLAGAAPDVPLDDVARALADARGRRLAAALAAAGERDLTQLWDELDAAEAALRAATGRRTQLLVQGARGRRQRRAVAALATALRAGRARRRELLAAVPTAHLLGALPLWVGTLGETEDILPPAVGMFDVVVVDEASQVDQVLAAPTLLRGRRAVVVGDPRQLRHVSFVADVDVDAALARHGLADHGAVLDVRRVSAFDAAAAAAPVRWLDDHVRSVPHLVAFSAARFYGDRLRVATQHPSVEQLDVIDTVHVDGTTEGGVVAAEVAAAVAEVVRLVDGGATSLGVVTPFRDQADALEDALLARLDVAALGRSRLRVGTVHAFQGGERDHVVLSLGVTADAPRRHPFAQDPHLCNVATTRARRRCTVVTSVDESVGGVLGAYLTHAERPPPAAPDGPPADGWTAALATELRRLGVAVRTGYRVGGELVDLVLGDGAGAVAVATRPHPAGAAAHVERRRLLRLAGWATLDALPRPWEDDAVRAALELRHRPAPG